MNKDEKFLQHLLAQAVLGQHPLHRLLNDSFGVLFLEVRVGLHPTASGIPGNPHVDLLLGLGPGHADVGSIYHDNGVTAVEVLRDRREMLPLKPSGNFHGHAAQHGVLGVDEMPGSFVFGLLDVGSAGSHGFSDGRMRRKGRTF